MIDVAMGRHGYHFTTVSDLPLENSTAMQAAAGALLLLEGPRAESGVLAPEIAHPSWFFEAMAKVTQQGDPPYSGIQVYRTVDGTPDAPVEFSSLLAHAYPGAGPLPVVVPR